MRIGPYELQNRLALAPMAGVTDLPFRRLCRSLGAGLAAAEMLTSDVRLYGTAKSRRRMDHTGEPEPRVVQIAGGDPYMLAEATRRNVDAGAQIIDINMGCPAKKVCNRAAGSALLRDEDLVQRILRAAVAAAADVPVTLKIRTGWDTNNRNGVTIARIAEDCGVQALAVHGRTRACKFGGEAEYATIAAIKRAVQIPIFANGDIDSPHKAQSILEQTGADGLMIGRSAQGRPWIFREINFHLQHAEASPAASIEEVRDIMLAHLCDLYSFYGEEIGVRVARKHIGWYLEGLYRTGLYTTQLYETQLYETGRFAVHAFRQSVMQVDSSAMQHAMTAAYFAELCEQPSGTLAAADSGPSNVQ